MKGTLKIILLVAACMTLILSGCAKQEKEAINLTTEEFIENFNSAAKETEFGLKKAYINDDKTKFVIETKNETAQIEGTIKDGKITVVDITGMGMFEPTMASYDYMIYAMMACDKSVEFEGADKFIADLYYEAYFGGDEVSAAYNGIQYGFEKEHGLCRLHIRNRQ